MRFLYFLLGGLHQIWQSQSNCVLELRNYKGIQPWCCLEGLICTQSGGRLTESTAACFQSSSLFSALSLCEAGSQLQENHPFRVPPPLCPPVFSTSPLCVFSFRVVFKFKWGENASNTDYLIVVWTRPQPQTTAHGRKAPPVSPAPFSTTEGPSTAWRTVCTSSTPRSPLQWTPTKPIANTNLWFW